MILLVHGPHFGEKVFKGKGHSISPLLSWSLLSPREDLFIRLGRFQEINWSTFHKGRVLNLPEVSSSISCSRNR